MTQPYELKPCLFCKNFINLRTAFQWGSSKYFVICDVCGAGGPMKSTKQEARDAWNTRTPDRSRILKLAAWSYYGKHCNGCKGNYTTQSRDGSFTTVFCRNYCDCGYSDVTHDFTPEDEKLMEAILKEQG